MRRLIRILGSGWSALTSTRFGRKRLGVKPLHLALLALCFAAPLRAAEPLPATCYLFAYFYHDREAEGFRLAWSPDGYKFEMLNGGQSCLKPEVGEAKIMRDPCLYQGPDGTWHLVWTTGWTGKTI